MNEVISTAKFAKLFNSKKSELWKKYRINEDDKLNPQLYVEYGYDKINYKTIDDWMFALCDEDIARWCGLHVVYTTPDGKVELTSTIDISKL
jgi:hypothetical protein